MNPTKQQDILIREINPKSLNEISLVASWMRQTLIEILGHEQGTSLYSMNWLSKQVLWHADPLQTSTKIFLIEDPRKKILAYTIARVKIDKSLNSYGYFALIFVEPSSRNKGLASLLLTHAEKWLSSMKMTKIICDTMYDQGHMIQLFKSHGYHITRRNLQIIQLTKFLN